MKSYRMFIEPTYHHNWMKRFVKFYEEVRKILPETWGHPIEIENEELKKSMEELANKHEINVSFL